MIFRLFVVLFLLIAITTFAANFNFSLKKEQVNDLIALKEWDPNPYHAFSIIEKKNKDDNFLKLRLSQGIIKWHFHRNLGQWWHCGEKLTYNEMREAAIKRGDLIYELSKKYDLNPWGVLGTIGLESNFDPCALGPHPRKAAYEFNLLTKNKRTISHSKKELISTLEDSKMKKRFNRTGVDLGEMQLLSRFWPKEYTYNDMINFELAIEKGMSEMAERQRIYKTKRPWYRWRTIKGSQIYDNKITYNARIMGATKKEI